MSELRTLRWHAAHYLGGRVGLLLLGCISFPLFTRLFTVEQYGEISLVFKVVICLVVLAKLGVQNSVVRFYESSRSAQSPESTRRFYSTFFIGGSGVALLVTLLFLLALWLVPSHLMASHMRVLLALAALLVLVRVQWSLLASFLQAEGRTILYNGFDLAIKGGIIVLVCAALYLWQRTLVAFFSATLLVELAAAAIAVAMLLRRRVLSLDAWDGKFFQEAIAFGLPLAVYEIASVVLDGGDRFLVLHYLGATQLGYYSAAYNLSTYAQTSLMSPINLAIIPIYMKLWKERGDGETAKFLGRSLDLYILGAVATCMVAALLARPLMVILASAKYATAAALLPVLIAALFIYTLHIFLTPGLLIHKKTAVLARQVVYATVLNLVLNVVLLPRMGIAGGAWATLISYVFLVLAIAFASRRFLRVTMEWRLLMVRVLTAFVIYECVAAILARTPASLALPALALGSVLSVVAYASILFCLDHTARTLTIGMWRRYGERLAQRTSREHA